MSVAGKKKELDRSLDGVVEEDADLEESEHSTHELLKFTGVRPIVTASLFAPTPESVPCVRAAPAGERGTSAKRYHHKRGWYSEDLRTTGKQSTYPLGFPR